MISRRQFVAAVTTVTGVSMLTAGARAGSYLDRAAVMLAHAGKEADFMRSRLSDKELGNVLHRLALARVKAARHMHIPKEVTAAHPHLLLALGQYERALDGAAAGSPPRFLRHQQEARKEVRVFAGILKQLGWSLPPV